MSAKSVNDPIQKEDCISKDDSWCCALASRHAQVERQSVESHHLWLTFIMVFCYTVLFSYWFVNCALCALDKVYPGSVCIRENICRGFSATHSLKFPQKHPLWMRGGCCKKYRYCISKNPQNTRYGRCSSEILQVHFPTTTITHTSH